MEEKKVQVRFLRSTNLIDPEAGEGKTVRSFAKDEVTEIDLETFEKLVKIGAVVPAGLQYGSPVSN